jgi:glutathione reductase (NADPH)
VSDDAFYLKTMPKKVVMVGSGYIALEFAGIFRALGAEVHVVYRQNLPLRGFDQDIREAMADALTAQGIVLHPGCLPEGVSADGDGRILTFGGGQTISADLVFFATGRRANVKGLGLEAVGVELNARHAIKVDDQLQTTAPHIYAMGDVTDRVNLTPVATAEGHALADTLFGGRPRGISLRNVPSAVFTTPPIGSVGLTEDQAAALGPVDVYVTKFTPMRHNLSGRGRKSLMKLVVEKETQKVVGAHMLGEDAAEIIQGVAIAVVMGATKADFDRTIGIHPTAAEEFVTLRTLTRTTDLAKAAE